MSRDKVLVRDAPDFAGSAVAHALIHSGCRFRDLLRPSSKRMDLADLDIEIMEGDMWGPPTCACLARWFIPLR